MPYVLKYVKIRDCLQRWSKKKRVRIVAIMARKKGKPRPEYYKRQGKSTGVHDDTYMAFSNNPGSGYKKLKLE